MWKRIKAYLETKLAGERFGRLFNNLANGNLVITTNDFLRWTIFIGTTAFLLIYLDFRMDYYTLPILDQLHITFLIYC